ncbi:Piso0_004813 [Millerozyma farinosa CBS 7064]|uniref:Piso0_004813 protein n=1 Tax=Pichia sorbitophila (strain ATCC MYA-4447 / BCRC 22081 / CBS 7064 / NBRC 10061 / NRRL Y-12695) TaxID=559304 RepID=G8Y0H7_PICSO|nr:Piso0_004813 [Millerozyma farinosa CBS 7064]
MDDEKLKAAIHNAIWIYEQSSKSKKYQRIAIGNESKITKSVLKYNRKNFIDLLSKRDYYSSKINKLLNEAVTDSDIVPDHKKDAQGTKLEPKYIANRFHASRYLETIILNDSSKKERIRALITKHFDLQSHLKELRENIIAKYKSTNDPKTKSILKEELNKWEEKAIYNLKNYAIETNEVMTDLKVPFFYIDPDYSYPDLDSDKIYLLDLMKEKVITSEHQSN